MRKKKDAKVEKGSEIPEGVRTIAKLSGESVEMLWNGTGGLALKTTLDTPAKIEIFDRSVRETVEQLKGTQTDHVVAMEALSRAGEAVLGPDRPARPGSVEDFIDQAVRSGIMRRVPAREPARPRPSSDSLFGGLLRRS